MIEPYYRSPDGTITVYCARWEDVHAAGLVPVEQVKLVHADPPYGVNERTDRASKGRSTGAGGGARVLGGSAQRSHDWPAVHGDDRPFDPAPLLALDRPSVLWGANHYSERVPGLPSWIFWDKREEQTPDDNADGELAWSNLGGALRKTEKEDRHLHPTQKPIALSTWIFRDRAKLKPGALVFVPYLGSGPDLPAAVALGLRVIACEVERAYCDTAIGRLGVVTPQRAAEPVGPLFGGAR